MISEYMRNETMDDAIQFDGRIVDGEKEYVASFPGVHFREWGRVTKTMQDKSVACVFVPGSSSAYGDHDPDPDHPGKCYCQSFLYFDTPAEAKRLQGYLMDESELLLGDAEPEVGNKIEVQLVFPSGEEKWWVCSVVRAGDRHIGVQPPGYSMEEFERQEGFEKVVESGDTFSRLSMDSVRRNTTGNRKASIQVG